MNDYEITLFSGAKVSKAVEAYAVQLEGIKDKRNRANLATVLMNRDTLESGNLSLAYYLNRISDEDARADGYKTASQMVIGVTGLSKAMVSNYRSVGAFITDANGNLAIPEYARGFSVTQIVEIRSKVADSVFEQAVNDKEIDNTMSAAKLRKWASDYGKVIDADAVDVTDDTMPDTTPDTTPDTMPDTTPDNTAFRAFKLNDADGNYIGIVSFIADGDPDDLLNIAVIGEEILR